MTRRGEKPRSIAPTRLRMAWRSSDCALPSTNRVAGENQRYDATASAMPRGAALLSDGRRSSFQRFSARIARRNCFASSPVNLPLMRSVRPSGSEGVQMRLSGAKPSFPRAR